MEEIPKQSETFLDRLRNEKNALEEKIDRLEDFITSEGFAKISRLQQDLLRVQLPSMCLYANVLKERLKDLDKAAEVAKGFIEADDHHREYNKPKNELNGD